jgi:hypothetical protein
MGKVCCFDQNSLQTKICWRSTQRARRLPAPVFPEMLCERRSHRDH